MARMKVISRCTCGKVKSKYLPKCKACLDQYLNQKYKEATAIVEKGVCPRCGSKLVRNNALPGWWQCSQYGNWKYREGDPNKSDCGFQTFTE